MKAKFNVLTRLLFITVMLLGVSIPATAERYTGKVDGKYPVVVYFNSDGDNFTGKYAYQSTLKKYGDKPSSWLYISGKFLGNYARCFMYDCEVRDYKGKIVEHWDVALTMEGYFITITTTKGKKFQLNIKA